MLRDKNLIPLSHQHQHALALCVRIERASPIPERDVDAWQNEIVQLCHAEIATHFAAEEAVLFPEACRFEQLRELVEDLVADHTALRGTFTRAEARSLSSAELLGLAQRLSAHIRKEERQLFERLQELLNQEELARVGQQLGEALKDTTQSCIIPSEQTKLRGAK